MRITNDRKLLALMRTALWAALIILLFAGTRAQADDAIVGYPTVGAFTVDGGPETIAYIPIGTYEGSMPYITDSGAAEFTLSGSDDVGNIVVQLFTFDSNAVTFSWSLQSALTGSPTVYASGDISVPGTASPDGASGSFSLAVNTDLNPGTYYLVGNSSEVGICCAPGFGWVASDGTEVSNGGTAPDGEWAGGSGSWSFYSSTISGCDTGSPCDFFTTFGIPSSVSPAYGVYATPEPSTLLLFGTGIALVGMAMSIKRRKPFA